MCNFSQNSFDPCEASFQFCIAAIFTKSVSTQMFVTEWTAAVMFIINIALSVKSLDLYRLNMKKVRNDFRGFHIAISNTSLRFLWMLKKCLNKRAVNNWNSVLKGAWNFWGASKQGESTVSDPVTTTVQQGRFCGSGFERTSYVWD